MCGGDQQARHEDREVETAVESPCRFGEVAVRIACEGERMVRPIERPFDVAQHGVEPAHASGFGGGATARALDDRVRMTGVDHGAERTESVAVDIGLRTQVAPGPVGQCAPNALKCKVHGLSGSG